MTSQIQYRGHRYRVAAAVNDDYWRGEQLLFWIYAVVDSKTGSDLPSRAKKLKATTWEKMPAEIRAGVGDDADVKAAILDCVAKGTCQYIAIEGRGWSPGERKGAVDVTLVQNTLEWIQQFQNRGVVSGSRLLWAEITSQVKRPR